MSQATEGIAGAEGATVAQAAFASRLSFDHLPPEVVERTKTCVLDTLGCCLFGATQPSVRLLAQMAASEDGGGEAIVIGTTQRASASMASLVNATAAHSFQLDEIHIQATLHPGSAALPAVLALAQAGFGAAAVSGRDLITALVAGYETALRTGMAARGSIFTRGYHNQGATGALVAAASAGRLLGLDPLQMQHALGIAGSQAAGLMAVQEGAMAKSFHCGRASQSGVYAAKLAALGYTGIPQVLEEPYGGFLSTVAIPAQCDGTMLTAGLGERWEILNVGYKPAPASNGSVSAMTALDTIMRSHGIEHGQIERMTAYVSSNTLGHCGWEYTRDKVQGVLAAQMNLRYGLAVMALEREATAAQFAPDRLFAPETVAFLPRIHVEHEPKYDGHGGIYRVACRLQVQTRDGARHETEVLFRKGSNEDPMTADELRRKFLGLAAPVLGDARAVALAAAVDRLETLEDLGPLSALLASH
jgi:2-methylcitrate dehydratase PrpD